jgi:hypothetical protein
MKKIKLYGNNQNIVQQFPCIHAWGQMSGSNEHYIVSQCLEAKRGQAPPDATFQRNDTGWHRLPEVTNEDTREWFRRNRPELVERFTTGSW